MFLGGATSNGLELSRLVRLRCVPNRKTFASSTTKFESEPSKLVSNAYNIQPMESKPKLLNVRQVSLHKGTCTSFKLLQSETPELAAKRKIS
ncbi:hypothetical protein Tco_0572883 [Tanacetum coccineum]